MGVLVLLKCEWMKHINAYSILRTDGVHALHMWFLNSEAKLNVSFFSPLLHCALTSATTTDVILFLPYLQLGFCRRGGTETRT
jgi:hypothetical protein